MNISALMNQNFGQYLSLLSNPTFLNAVKTAAGGSDNSGKYDALFANLEKLSSLLSQSNSDNSSTDTSGTSSSANPTSSITSLLGSLLSPTGTSGASASTDPTSSITSLLNSLNGTSSTTDPTTGAQGTDTSAQLNKLEVDALGQIADQLIANADLMENALDLNVTPADQELAGLFQKLRDIIAQLDTDTRQVQQDAKNKEVKAEYKLRPDSNTKSGFQEGITLLAQ